MNRMLLAAAAFTAALLLAGATMAQTQTAQAQTAQAQTAQTEVDRVATLQRWVEAQFATGELPAPAVVADRTALGAVSGMAALTRPGERVKALYVPGIVILDPQAFQWDDTDEVSYLLHELVHHVQVSSGRSFPCNNAMEADAYRLQNQWLIEQGRQPLYSDRWIAGKATCP
ncbi:DUF6647 family protein [Oleisolibacter albus]|uniref:DUF6647 family protein n=1 Tax=Oleisolibacter albus TaxID=2171757 RepID=UPI000DF47D4C|nr:DUF6647 family protein [Oleisolibacter albus]